MRARLAVGSGMLCALVASGLAIAGSAHAGNAPTPRPGATAATTATGRFVPTAPTRIVDTRSKTGVATTTPVPGGRSLTVGMPSAVSSAATSVVLNLGVTRPSAGGFVTAYTYGTPRPMVSTLNFAGGQTVANAVVVPLGSGGRVTFYLGSRGHAHLFADLSGYFRSSTENLGGFGTVSPTRALDTRTGTGAAKGAVASGKTVSFRVIRGTADIPDDASAVVLNLAATQPGASGFATAYPAGSTRPTASNLNFTAGRTVPNLAVVPIGDHGEVTIYNGSSRSTQFFADLQGYLAGGEPTTVGALGALAPQRLVDTRSRTPIPSHGSLAVAVLGRGGVPSSKVLAVVVNVAVTQPSAGGYLTAYSGGRPRVSSLNFSRGQTVANLVVVKPDPAGRVTLYNGSSGRTHAFADVAGYVLNDNVTVPATTTSRYVSSLSAISDSGTEGEGCADAKSGATFVLLDIGAQTKTKLPGGGVALAQTNPTVRASYGDLVSALDGYLQGFAACHGSGRIALGTNNDGAFSGPDAYPASTRGTDWANRVVRAVAPHAGVTVVGANDIEAGFASTEAQAEDWIRAFLAVAGTKLVYNGSLDRCPDSYAPGGDCAAAAGKTEVWTLAQYVHLTYGLGPGRITVLPQIYFSNAPNQAVQWRNLYVASGKKLTFEGSLTQYRITGNVTSGFTGAQGWSALYHALSTVTAAPSLPVATDLVIR